MYFFEGSKFSESAHPSRKEMRRYRGKEIAMISGANDLP